MNLLLRNRSSYPLSAVRLSNPFGGLIENMLEEFLSTQSRSVREEGSFSPRIEVRENDQDYIVAEDLTGVTKDNLKISVEGHRITIEAEVRRESLNKEGESVIHTERVARKYTRSIEVAKPVNYSV